MLPGEKEAFGFKDGISHPAVQGSGIPGTNPKEQPFKAGEFILGYPDEIGEVEPMPRPEVLGKNGSYIVFRKLHQRVAAFRQYLKANSSSPRRGKTLGGEVDGTLAERRAAGSLPLRDDPNLEPTRSETTISSSRMTTQRA